MASSFRLLAGLRIGVPGRSDREHRPHRFTRKERKRMTGLSVPELGRRGGGWGVVRSILFVAIAACGFVGVYWPGSVESYLAVIGFVLIVGGLVVVVTGALTLGRSFTHLPRPRGAGAPAPHPPPCRGRGGPDACTRAGSTGSCAIPSTAGCCCSRSAGRWPR